MKQWKDNGYSLILVHSKYQNNDMDYFGFVIKGDCESYIDVTCNTPLNKPGTITFDHNFLDICPELAEEFKKEYCTERLDDVISGYCSLQKYKVDMDKLLSDAINY